jgi:hypothetical protein
MIDSSETYGQGFQKSILIILFLFLTFALIITWNTPSTGFESSIYNSTPLVLWIALISSEIVGVSIVILSISNSDFGRSNLWKYGFLLIFLCYAVGVGLIIIRGYFMWGMFGDPASHLGWTMETLQTGYIPQSIFYPIFHIFLSEISLVTTLNPVFFQMIFPFFFSLLCVVFFYIFVRILSSDHITPIIAVIISCTFAFGWHSVFTPNALANLFFPLALFLIFKYLKSSDFSWGILLCIVLILYPVFHPLPAIVLGLIFLTLWIPQKVHDVWNGIREHNINLLKIKRMNVKVVIPFLILLVWFIFWYSFYSIWGYTITEVYSKIRAEGGPSQLMSLEEQINYAQAYGYNVVEIFLKQYSNLLLLSILSVCCFLLLWITVSREQKQENIFSLYGPWAILCIIVPVLYLFNLPFGPLRFFFYVSMLGTLFAAYLISNLLVRSRESKRRVISRLTSIVVVVVLVGLFLLGLFNLYPSPYILTFNFQTTQSEVSGMIFFFEYHDNEIPVTGITAATTRFADLLLPLEKKSVQNLEKIKQPLWHFGYNQSPSIASSYDKETNLIISQRDKVIYTDYFPDMAKFRFTQEDFKRLYNDPGASLLYSNGGFDFLTVIPDR